MYTMGRPFWADLIGEFPYENQSRAHFKTFFKKWAKFKSTLILITNSIFIKNFKICFDFKNILNFINFIKFKASGLIFY